MIEIKDSLKSQVTEHDLHEDTRTTSMPMINIDDYQQYLDGSLSQGGNKVQISRDDQLFYSNLPVVMIIRKRKYLT